MFEDLKANIEILEKRRDISIEDLIDSMCKLFEGAAVPKDAIFDIMKYGNALVNLFDHIIPTYRDNAKLLEKLNDEEIGEDIDDVMSSSRAMEEKLDSVRSLLKTLDQEKKRFQELEIEYNEENQKKVNLEREIAKLQDISPDEIRAWNIKLEEEKERRIRNEQLFDEIQKKINIEQTSVDDLTQKKKKCETERQKLEEEKTVLLSDISDYENWEKKYKEEINQIRERVVESVARLNIIRNAWSSVKEQWDLPERVNTSQAFVRLDKDINSFSDLEHWMEVRGQEIEKAVTEYSNMYRALLDVLNEKK